MGRLLLQHGLDTDDTRPPLLPPVDAVVVEVEQLPEQKPPLPSFHADIVMRASVSGRTLVLLMSGLGSKRRQSNPCKEAYDAHSHAS